MFTPSPHALGSGIRGNLWSRGSRGIRRVKLPGEGLGLDAADRKLLDREGDINRVELGYLFGDDTLKLRPSAAWIDQDIDGDKENPIFGEVNDAEVYAFASVLQIPRPFGWDKWFTTVAVSYGENQADIAFNKSSAAMFAARLGQAF